MKFYLIAFFISMAFVSTALAQSKCVCKTTLNMPNGNSKVFCSGPTGNEHQGDELACKSYCVNVQHADDGIWGSNDDVKFGCTSGPTATGASPQSVTGASPSKLSEISHSGNNWVFQCGCPGKTVSVKDVQLEKDAVLAAAKMCWSACNTSAK